MEKLTVNVPQVPNSPQGHIWYISNERSQVIQRLALESAKIKGVPGPDNESAQKLVPRLDAFLAWLDTAVHMTAELKTRSRVDEGLALMFRNPKFHFSPEHQQKARELYEKWDAERWGAPTMAAPTAPRLVRPRDNDGGSSSSSTEDETSEERSHKRRKSDVGGASDASVKPVPPEHPIWGVDGIMHGMARKRSGRKVTVFDPAYKHAQRDARRHGHNGVPVGAWFPYQLVALFHGAHGASQAGIHHGDPGVGAYSIVVAALYDALDHDRGHRLWYSGSGSHENADASRVAERTRGTNALHQSMGKGTPVRVLRSSSGRSRFAPACGIRYDGLYEVVACREKRNAKGGLYEQFELERMEGQMSLEECQRRPTVGEVRAFDKIERGY